VGWAILRLFGFYPAVAQYRAGNLMHKEMNYFLLEQGTLVHLVTCDKCRTQPVGETKLPLRERLLITIVQI